MTGFTKFLAVSALLVCLLTGVVTMSFDKEIAFASQSADGVGVVSARGVWHRPDDTGTEKDAAGVCAFLDKLQRAGVNLVFLETFYHGMAMYRSTFVPYYTKFQSYSYGEYADYMSCFVAEADKRGIEVHAWVEDFYIGIEENYFTKNLPEWLLVTDKGSTRNTEGGGYIFLDPANAEVKNYLASFYDELLTAFPTVAGLNLVYLRYPVSDQGDDTGYTQAAITAFCGQNNIDGSFTATEFAAYVKKNGLYSAWVDFRAAQVTDFVRTVFESVRTKHPDKLLSTAIFPEPSLSYNTKKQDFGKWIERGYIDIVTPMAYYDNPATLKSALAEMSADCDKCFCYAGLSATYHKLSDAAVIKQLEVCNETGMDGFVFFGAKSLVENDSYVELLHKRFGTVSSVTPHATVGKLYEATVTPLVDYLDKNGDGGNTDELVAALDKLKTCNEYDAESLAEGVKALRLVVKYNLSQYVSEQNLDVAKQCLGKLYRFVSVKQSRLEARGGSQPVDPEPTPPVEPDNGNEGNKDTDKKGCFGTIGASGLALVMLLAASSVATKKR